VRRAALIALLAAALAGCGGAGTTAPAPETVEGPAETQAETGSETTGGGSESGDPTAGKAIYAQNGCGSCHTFDPAESDASVGPNLNELPDLAEKADRGSVDEFTSESISEPSAYIEEGFPEIMPTYDELDERELADLVAFLTES